MSAVDIKLRRKFDATITPIDNAKIEARLTGTKGQSFLEIKIPVESIEHSAGSDGDHRGFSALPVNLDIFNNQFFMTPVVIDTAATTKNDNTSNVQIDISLVVKSKKPWDGTL